MTKVAKICSLVLLLGCSSCASRSADVVRVVERESKAWTGKARADLIRIWGEPARVQQVDGGEELLYFSYDPILQPVLGPMDRTGMTPTGFNPWDLEVGSRGIHSSLEVRDVEHATIARFRLDETGQEGSELR